MTKSIRQSSSPQLTGSTSLLRWALPLIFCALALRIGHLVYDRGFSSYDDGVAAEGAWLILHGAIPYRDFWTMYAPGSFYVNALACALMGESMLSIRLFGLLAGVLQSGLFIATVRRTAGSIAASITCAAVYLALIPLGSPTYWLTTTMAAVYFFVRFVEEPKAAWRTLAGLSAGLTLLFRQDAGAYLIIALAGCAVLAAPGDRKPKLKQAGVLVTWALVPPMAAAFYFAANHALGTMIDCAIRFPALVFPRVRPLPYPLPWSDLRVIGDYWAPRWIALLYQTFAFYLLPATMLAFCVISVRGVLRDGGSRRGVLAASLFCVALALVLMIRVRPSAIRIVGAVAVSAIAFAVAASEPNRTAKRFASAGLAVSLISLAPFGAYTVWAQRVYAPCLIPGRGGVRAAMGHAESIWAAGEAVRKLTRPDEKVLCGTPAIYFLAARSPATRFYEPHPAVTDTPHIQRVIVADMERSRVRYFVRSTEWDRNGYFTIEPEHQPTVLIDYIKSNYRPMASCGVFRIYERKTPFGRER